jgi:hypothetical protein
VALVAWATNSRSSGHDRRRKDRLRGCLGGGVRLIAHDAEAGTIWSSWGRPILGPRRGTFEMTDLLLFTFGTKAALAPAG